MVLERSMHPDFLSNTYLVGQTGGPGFFVDAGGPVAPLIEAAERLDVRPTHVLLTHHHYDHVCETDALLQRWPDLQVLIHPDERGAVEAATGLMHPQQPIQIGDLEVLPLHTPGHTAGMLSLYVQGNVFTGDTLFRNSVGGVRAPGHTTYDDLKRSIMETLMGLPPDTVIRPGHSDPTTVLEEWETNAFIRVWRGLDPEGDEPCTALGEPASLVLLGQDYDGGTKAWIRWRAPNRYGLAGADDIVPGSRVTRGQASAEA